MYIAGRLKVFFYIIFFLSFFIVFHFFISFGVRLLIILHCFFLFILFVFQIKKSQINILLLS